MNRARIMIAAPASGSGKTMVSCGLLSALKERGMPLSAFKCGPDYIDPMFHEKVIGVKSGNLDMYFSGETLLKELFFQNSKEEDMCLIEGVMGYYDGLGAASSEASSYAVAKALKTPVILVIDARGQSLSALAVLKGFTGFKEDSGIKGVIFNRMPERVYISLKKEVEKLGVKPLGFLPKSSDMAVESRHLGLVTPDEIEDMSLRLKRLGRLMENNLDMEGIIALAEGVRSSDAAEISPGTPCAPKKAKVRIALARDEAFCFMYRDNLALLERLGAELIFFSPLHDSRLPEGAQGLILYGGYPELYAERLSKNTTMLESIRAAIGKGLPCLAECGGFMYLHRELEDMEGRAFPMAGVIDARCKPSGNLDRFGYIELRPNKSMKYLGKGEFLRAHEFHYYKSDDEGNVAKAVKPSGDRSWDCLHEKGNMLAGFPHMFYPSNPGIIKKFLAACSEKEGLDG